MVHSLSKVKTYQSTRMSLHFVFREYCEFIKFEQTETADFFFLLLKEGIKRYALLPCRDRS